MLRLLLSFERPMRRCMHLRFDGFIQLALPTGAMSDQADLGISRLLPTFQGALVVGYPLQYFILRFMQSSSVQIYSIS